MASAFQIVKALSLPVVAALQNRTPELVAAQLVGLAPDPQAAAKRGHSGIENLIQSLAPVVASFIPGGSTGYSLATKLTQAQPTPQTVASVRSNINQVLSLGGSPMSFADGSSGGIFDSFPSLPDLTNVFQGGLGQNLLNLGTQAASQFITSQFAPAYSPFNTPSPGGAAMPVMAAVPAIARGGAVVGRGFFNRFPNLAVVIQSLRNQGKSVTRAKLWSLMKRFGPDFLISGGILTAAAASELAMAGPGRRRMNAGNVKALRKAHRRMTAFHHICTKNDTLLHARRRKTAPNRFGGTSITQVK
jgi:hypothetical protein